MKKISISTTTAKDLKLRKLTNLVDIVPDSIPKVTERNTADATYVANSKAVGCDGALEPVAGQTALHAYPTPNDHPGSGYNADPNNPIYKGLSSDDPGTFKNYGNGVLAAPWPSDFPTRNRELGTNCGWKFILVDNPSNTYEQLKSRINFFGAANVIAIIVGVEKVACGMTADVFLATELLPRFNSLQKDFPAIEVIPYAALIYMDKPAVKTFNKLVPSFPGTKVTQYLQVQDMIYGPQGEGFSTNMDQNFEDLKKFFTVTLPQSFTDCKAAFGNKKRLYVETNVGDNRKNSSGQIPGNNVNNTLLGEWTIHNIIETLVKNQDDVDGYGWMSHQNLFNPDNTLKPNGLALAQENKILKPGRKITQLTLTGMDGVTGYSIQEGNHHYVSIANENACDVAVDQIEVDGNIIIKTAGFNINGRYAVNALWNGTVASYNGSSMSQVNLKQRGYFILDFVVS